MKWSAVVPAGFLAAALLTGALSVASPRAGTPAISFVGVIYDNRCSDGVCATQCPISKTPKYTLQTDTEAWLLSDQKTPAKYLGKRVRVTGRVAGNKLLVTSIALPGSQAN